MHMKFLSLELKMTIHPARKAQIASLLAKEITVPVEYADFANVFSKKSAKVLPKHTGMNKHAIEKEDGKQPSYELIYSLGLVGLETLKIYIKTNLANGFIQSLKYPAGTPILFVRKPNSSFRLCIDYHDLNNLTIKNRYLLSLIGESLDWLGRAKRFTQLDFTSAYHWIRIKEDEK